MSISHVYVSADQDYLAAAIAELRGVFPDATITPKGADLLQIMGDGISIASVATAVRDHTQPLVFARHLMRGVGQTPLPAEIEDLEETVETAIEAWDRVPHPEQVSLQVWASGDEAPELPIRMDELWYLFADSLADEGIEVVRAGRDHILSACVTADGIIFGSNQRANALSDWPGGRVRLAKPKGQISRSEFKLEELLRSHDIALPTGDALDLGASPGGWTRILRTKGLEVWAIDPGNLDPRVLTDRKVHHIRTTANTFFQQSDQTFDVIVNDMRMTPQLSTELMLTASGHLKPRGMIIQTLKISESHALDMVRQSLRALRGRYEIDFARQLHHNRNEVTVVAHRRD